MDADNNNNYVIKGGNRVIVGSADLNYKRDNMDIQPFFLENGMCKLKISSHLTILSSQ